MRSVAVALLDLVYPPICAGCGQEPWADGEILGDRCLNDLVWTSGRDCRKCGRVLGPHADPGSCLDCRGRSFAFARAVGAVAYRGLARKLVRRMKINRQAYLAGHFARWLARRLKDEQIAADLATCVPDRWSGRVRRGFNPADEIARRVAKDLGLGYEPRLLRRVRRTPRQVELTRAARLANPVGVFAVRRGASLKGKRILLVDDVMTTGATLDACARALKAAGAKTIFAAAVARS